MQLSSDTGIPTAFRLVDRQLAQVRKLIDKQLCVSDSASLADTSGKVMSYVRRQMLSGKMLRPGLLLLSYQLVRDSGTNGRVAE